MRSGPPQFLQRKADPDGREKALRGRLIAARVPPNERKRGEGTLRAPPRNLCREAHSKLISRKEAGIHPKIMRGQAGNPHNPPRDPNIGVLSGLSGFSRRTRFAARHKTLGRAAARAQASSRFSKEGGDERALRRSTSTRVRAE